MNDIPVSHEKQESLTPVENKAIIASLFEADTEEKKLAYRIAWFQLLIAITSSFATYGYSEQLQTAIAVLSGGMVSVVNGGMLAWRMSRPDLLKACDKHDPITIHRHLRLLYFYAAERYAVVVVLLALCLVKLNFQPLALLGGFIFVQASMMVARIFTFKLKYR